jgi:hypothetical protein
MCALGICYSKYWLTDTFKVAYPVHIATLKTFYGTTKMLWAHVDVEIEDLKE